MSISLKDRSLISIYDYTPEEICHILDIAEKKGVLNRALETTVPSEVYEALRREVNARKN